METKILVAHPGKHHVLHLVAGCIQSGASVKYVTPFYRCGIGRLVSALPGKLGKKALGYFHPGIPLQDVVSPVWWQTRKLIALFNNETSYERDFDQFVAHKIETGKYRVEVLVTLQDYMPRTVRAAKRKGIIIWSDQILNQSKETASRITRHEMELGGLGVWPHNEQINIDIIAFADVITCPSSYCLSGIMDSIASTTRIVKIPYGASPDIFSVSRLVNSEEVIVLARANSVRKGGHLLLDALQRCGGGLLAVCAPKKIRFVILGTLETIIHDMLDRLVLPDGLTVEHGNVPHAMVAQLYQNASLFVMPSLSEGMSLACMEAMHAGLPLIISKYCGIDGFLDSQMGFEILDTVESLCDALIAAFNNHHLWQQWGDNSRDLARYFTWEAYEQGVGRLAGEILR